MNKNEIILSTDAIKKHYREIPGAYIAEDFIFFENIYSEDYYNNRYTVQDGLLISLLDKGKIELNLNFKKYRIEAPSVITVFPTSIYESYIATDNAKITSLFITVDCINESFFLSNLDIISRMVVNPIVTVPKETMRYLHRFNDILSEISKLKESPLYETILKNVLYAFFLEIITNYSCLNPGDNSGKDTYQKEITLNFLALLKGTHSIERGVASYADKLSITPKSLSDAVKSTTGFSAIKWVNGIIIFQAKKMLKFTSLSVQQISEELNFHSSSFFIYFFKEKTGMTPLVYRKKINN